MYINDVVINIERKGTFVEFIQNITSRQRVRFEKTLERLSKEEHKLFIIEDDIECINSTIASLPTRLTARNVNYWLYKISVVYKIPILYLGKRTKTSFNMKFITMLEVLTNVRS